MDGTMVTLFRDLKHGKRLKAQDPQAKDGRETMPVILPPTRPRYDCQKGTTTYPQVEVARRLLCTSTPPPSLQSQSLPRIRLHGNANRKQPRHSDSHVSHRRRTELSRGTAAPSLKHHTTQSLPSLPYSSFGRARPGGNKKKNPQRSSTFDLFKTSSRHGYGTARANQNFAWDFGHKNSESRILPKDKVLPKTKGPEPNQRPVHLYMCVEMMDKFLEKRKGLRSDDTLNELIGLPTAQKRVSDRPAKKTLREDKQLMKCKKTKDTETEEARKHKPPSDAMKSEEQVSQDGLHDDRMEAEPASQQDAEPGEEEFQGNKMETEFEDNEVEEELGLLVDDEDSEVFDACDGDEEDDEEDDREFDEKDDEEIDEEEDGRELEEEDDDCKESDDDQAEDDYGNDEEDDNEEDVKDNEEAEDGSEAENIDVDDDDLEDDEADGMKEEEEADEDDDQDKGDEGEEDGDDDDDNEDEGGNGDDDEQDTELDVEESDGEDDDKMNNDDDDDDALSEDENDSNEEEPG